MRASSTCNSYKKQRLKCLKETWLVPCFYFQLSLSACFPLRIQPQGEKRRSAPAWGAPVIPQDVYAVRQGRYHHIDSTSCNERVLQMTEVMLRPPVSIDHWVDIREVHRQLCLHLAGHPSNGIDPLWFLWAFRSHEIIKKECHPLLTLHHFQLFTGSSCLPSEPGSCARSLVSRVAVIN